MEPRRGCSAGSTTSVRLVPSASGLPGHSAAPASVDPKRISPPMAVNTLRVIPVRIVLVLPPHSGCFPAVSTLRNNATLTSKIRNGLLHYISWVTFLFPYRLLDLGSDRSQVTAL